MQSTMAMMLSKSRTLIKTLNPSLSSTLKSISTFSLLSQEAQLAEPPPLPPSPLPPNPVSSFQRRRLAPSTTVTFLNDTKPFQIRQTAIQHDVHGLKNVFANWMTSQQWGDIVEVFEIWTSLLDRDGKPKRPDVLLYNHYLRAHLMLNASPGKMLDLISEMERFAIEPDTASFNLVLKAMHHAGETEAAEKLLERMLLSGKESQPDEESYELVVGMLFQKNQIDSALKYVDLILKSGHMLSRKLFSDCVRNCINMQRLDTLVLLIEKCKAMDQNKDLCPSWFMCNTLADVAIQNDHSKLTFLALEFMAKWIARGEVATPPTHLSVDEGLVISALATASRTYSPTLLDASWSILKRSLRNKKNPEPATYLAKIGALASLGNLQRAFSTLHELERAHSANEAAEDLFSPFTSLYPLVVACTKKGFETLDSVYFQLENLSRADPPYKSVAALNCIILGCANIWDLDRAYQTFEAISSTFGLTPDIHSYNALVYAFGKIKKTFEATRVFEHLCSLGLKPNAKTYNLLVDAHLINRDPKAALSVVESILEAGFQPSRETLKKVRRRCLREMDYESNDRVESFAKQCNIFMGNENRRTMLFNLEYSTEYA